MGFIDWLLVSITVSRRLTNTYYVIMLIITLIAVIIAYKLRFKRFSLYLWLVSGLICLFWELYLFSTGARNYNFPVILELPYHAFTEAGPGLIIMILVGHIIGLFDISEYHDDSSEPLESYQPSRDGKSINRTSGNKHPRQIKPKRQESEQSDEPEEEE